MSELDVGALHQIIITTIIFRGLILLLVTLTGALSIYLGWKLFMSGVDSVSTAEAASGNIKIKLMRVAPGTLFAVFGAAIQVYIVINNLELNTSSNENQNIQHKSHYSGFQFSQADKSNSLINVAENKLEAKDKKSEECLCGKQSNLSIKFFESLQTSKLESEEIVSSIETLLKLNDQIFLGLSSKSIEVQKEYLWSISTLSLLLNELKSNNKISD